MSRALARVAIGDTFGRYIHAVDGGPIDDFLALFTEDGILSPHQQPDLPGRAAIRQFLEASRASRTTSPFPGRIRHNLTSVFIEFEADDRASATSYFIAFHGEGPDHWGVYEDRLTTLDGDTWLLQHRTVTLEGATPGGWVASLFPNGLDNPSALSVKPPTSD